MLKRDRSTVAVPGCVIATVFLVTHGIAQYVSMPQGSFTIGTDHGDPDERPARSVHISSFAIDAHEVTNAQFDSCVLKGACNPPHYGDGVCLMWTGTEFRRVTVPEHLRGPQQPVVCVTWSQARAFCRWRSSSLPTEAQWEYAALAGGTSTYSWGNAKPEKSRCATADEGRPRQVKVGQPNAWNLFDMTGNVWEWTADRYQRDLYSTMAASDPQADPVGYFVAIRGGGWYSGPDQLRIKNRHWFAADKGEVSVGFRCVK